ncbi:hypothetical protein C8N26_1978 [Tenacibaculum lutimaris]|uniref:Uncharacterized protein n=1 Tax=Tenacibaculum lutimaris TaxID=285258 RepID=A0A420E0L7_9FLAO|nr:hypothetical protein [Tenacibaculum lutimaris]RKF03588.1 hypothetical protein C8N26_1978 [Tenacibaculum lutimaris]
MKIRELKRKLVVLLTIFSVVFSFAQTDCELKWSRFTKDIDVTTDIGKALVTAIDENPETITSWWVFDTVGEDALRTNLEELSFVTTHLKTKNKTAEVIVDEIKNAGGYVNWKNLVKKGAKVFKTFSKPIEFGGDIVKNAGKKLNIIGRVNPSGSMGTKRLFNALKRQGIEESEMTGLFKPMPTEWVDMKVIDMNTKYWKEINAPHIDDVIANGGDIRFIHDPRLVRNQYNLVNDMSDKNPFKAKCIKEGLTKIKTFMSMEYDYLVSKGYTLLDNGLMVKK